MNILYLSSHSILEWDEIKILTEIGHTVFSLHGAYQNGQGDGKRPSINIPINIHINDLSMQCSRDNIHPELIEWSDVIIVMHRHDWIENNWSKIKNKKVIWRTIGQCNQGNEHDVVKLRKEGLKIIRMSPTEETIPEYNGSDALIRFSKDEDEFIGYEGNVPRVVNVSQALFGNNQVHSRGDHMNIDIFKKVMDGFDWRIYGPDNENAGDHNGGMLLYQDMKNMFRFNRCFFYTGTEPSPYTLAFIEAMMTGIPVVAIGIDTWIKNYKNQKTYEIPSIIENGVNGFISDSIPELKGYIDKLLKDRDYAKEIGQKGRIRAIELFGKGARKVEWNEFLKRI